VAHAGPIAARPQLRRTAENWSGGPRPGATVQGAPFGTIDDVALDAMVGGYDPEDTSDIDLD
jgi:hypothetical protein